MSHYLRAILWTFFVIGLFTAVFGAPFFSAPITELFVMTLPLPSVVCFWIVVGCVSSMCLIGLATIGAPSDKS